MSRNIDYIYLLIDGTRDIVFESEGIPNIEPNAPRFLRRYRESTISDVFRAMGCQLPLNQSMADWMFRFLRECPPPFVAQILGTTETFFESSKNYSAENRYVILSRNQFHRLVCASLHVHQFRKIRYCVDFRLALDFLEDRRFFILLLSGAPGTGKSTMASLIASRMSVNHILSTDSVRHTMRTFYPQDKYPVLYKSTYECGDLVDPEHKLPYDERCVKGYLAQSELVGVELMKIIESFVMSHASLIVEGVHLSIELILRIVTRFPNVVPFLIYIKKEDFHRQRFAVRAKYMTTDPSMNKYISNFGAIRAVQGYLSKSSNLYLIPKIDNRNIDRSMETMHQTLFSYLKKLEGRATMFDPETQRLTFLDSIWKRRKQKIASKTNTLNMIKALKKAGDAVEAVPRPECSLKDLMTALPREGQVLQVDDIAGDVIEYLPNGAMLLKHEPVEKKDAPEADSEPTVRVHIGDDDFADTETDFDPAEVTLTDFVETTDSEVVEWRANILRRAEGSGESLSQVLLQNLPKDPK